MQDVDVGAGIQTRWIWVLKWDSSEELFVPGEASSSIAGAANTTGTSY